MQETLVKITGQVQGVFFRRSCQDLAQQLGVNGWVKNCSDGSVEALFQCPAVILNQMLTWIQQGPVHAKVENVRILSQKDCTNPSEGFNIIYEETL